MFMRATHISRKTFHLFCSMMKIYQKKNVKNRKTDKLLNPSALWIITQKIWKNILPWKNFAFHPKIMYRKSSTLNWFPFSSLYISIHELIKLNRVLILFVREWAFNGSIVVIIIIMFGIIFTIDFASGYINHAAF